MDMHTEGLKRHLAIAAAHQSLIVRAVNADGRHRLVAAHLTIAAAEEAAAIRDAHEEAARAAAERMRPRPLL